MLGDVIGWIGLIVFLSLLLKFVFNKKKDSRIAKFTRKYHRQIVSVFIAVVALHAIFTLSEVNLGISAVSGFVCLIVALVLCISYHVMKKKKMKWITSHRVMAAVLLLLIIIHIALSIHATH